MIREYRENDLEAILNMWLNVNITVHDFISPDYWVNCYDSVKKMLPESTIYVYVEEDVIQGFVGLQENYVAGLFVDKPYRSKGIGKALLDHAKERKDTLTLHVYKENARAAKFYKREGFFPLSERTDENTGCTEIRMEWGKGMNHDR